MNLKERARIARQIILGLTWDIDNRFTADKYLEVERDVIHPEKSFVMKNHLRVDEIIEISVIGKFV